MIVRLGPAVRTSHLLAVTLFAAPLAAQEPAPVDPLVSHETERYRAYAPSEAELEPVIEGMERAVQRFERYFGEAPPEVAFVSYGTPAQRDAHTEDRLGVPVYAISSRRPNLGSITVFNEVGLVLGTSSSGAPVVRATWESDVPGLGLRQGDRIVGVGGHEVDALSDLIELRRQWAPGLELTLRAERDGAVVERTFDYPGRGSGVPPSETLSEAMSYVETSPPDVSFVAHEAAHKMVSARFGSVGSWFQEGFASMAELPDDVARRAGAMRERAHAATPWERFFAMPHPAAAVVAGDGNGGTGAPGEGSAGEGAADVGAHRVRASAGGEVRIPSGASEGDGPRVAVVRAEGAGLYYSQAMTILQYVEEVGGTGAVARLAEWLSADRSALAFPLPLEGEEATLAEHEARWREWLGAS